MGKHWIRSLVHCIVLDLKAAQWWSWIEQLPISMRAFQLNTGTLRPFTSTCSPGDLEIFVASSKNHGWSQLHREQVIWLSFSAMGPQLIASPWGRLMRNEVRKCIKSTSTVWTYNMMTCINSSTPRPMNPMKLNTSALESFCWRVAIGHKGLDPRRLGIVTFSQGLHRREKDPQLFWTFHRLTRLQQLVQFGLVFIDHNTCLKVLHCVRLTYQFAIFQ